MDDASLSSVTKCVAAINCGDESRVADAKAELQRLVLKALHGLVKSSRATKNLSLTLQTADVVQEAWLRLWDKESSRLRVFTTKDLSLTAAGAVKRALVDHARKRSTLKRDHTKRESFENLDLLGEAPLTSAEDIIDIDTALERLKLAHPRHYEIMLLVYFQNRTIPEIAELLSLSKETVMRDHTYAKAFLARQLKDFLESERAE